MKASNNGNTFNVLVISTQPPSYSGNLGGDIISALQSQGCNVDYLSRFPENQSKRTKCLSIESKYSLDNIKSKIRTIVNVLPFKSTFNSLLRSINKLYYKTKPHKISYIPSTLSEGIALHHFDESRPFIPTGRIVKSINKQYDFIVTLYWHRFINSTTLREIYNKYQTPILIWAIDMAHITGGCQYFKNCRNFQNECGCCPALNSNDPKDQTHKNYVIKKQNYQSIKCALIGNTWINRFAAQSKLFDNKHLYNISCVIDEDIYHPESKITARKGSDKSIILLIRSSKELRKGGRYALDAIQDCFKALPQSITDKINIHTIGDDTIQKELTELNISCIDNGIVSRDKLIQLYQVATYFLSPSVDDAGPSMVNQSMMCGTPVVCFNNGTAMDVIQNRVDGFKTDDISSDGYAALLKEAVLIANTSQYEQMCLRARESALKYNSKQAVGRALIEVYKSIR